MTGCTIKQYFFLQKINLLFKKVFKFLLNGKSSLVTKRGGNIKNSGPSMTFKNWQLTSIEMSLYENHLFLIPSFSILNIIGTTPGTLKPLLYYKQYFTAH